MAANTLTLNKLIISTPIRLSSVRDIAPVPIKAYKNTGVSAANINKDLIT
jgi:hypothetical protein